jgi:hypothetical protein
MLQGGGQHCCLQGKDGKQLYLKMARFIGYHSQFVILLLNASNCRGRQSGITMIIFHHYLKRPENSFLNFIGLIIFVVNVLLL